MLVAEDVLRVTAELAWYPFVPDRETPHRNAVHPVDPLGQLVPPGEVVARARGHDLDVGMPRKAFRDVPGVQLRAAVDVSAVPLNRDRELHESDEVSASESASTPASDWGASLAPPDGASWEAWLS
jgi:hypothetical protein